MLLQTMLYGRWKKGKSMIGGEYDYTVIYMYENAMKPIIVYS